MEHERFVHGALVGLDGRRRNAAVRLVVMIAAVSLLSACPVSGRYSPSREFAPALWRVPTGVESDLTKEVVIADGEFSPGDVLLRVPVRPKGVGRLRAPWQFRRSSFDDEVQVPAGALLIAEQFLMRQTMYINTVEVASTVQTDDPNLNPVEWCLVAEPVNSVCLYWENGERVRVIETPRKGATFLDPETSFGHVAAMPDLELAPDAAVDAMTVVYQVSSVNSAGIVLTLTLETGDHVQQLQVLPLSFGPDRVHVIDRASFILEPAIPATAAAGSSAGKVRLRRMPNPFG